MYLHFSIRSTLYKYQLVFNCKKTHIVTILSNVDSESEQTPCVVDVQQRQIEELAMFVCTFPWLVNDVHFLELFLINDTAFLVSCHNNYNEVHSKHNVYHKLVLKKRIQNITSTNIFSGCSSVVRKMQIYHTVCYEYCL